LENLLKRFENFVEKIRNFRWKDFSLFVRRAYGRVAHSSMKRSEAHS
jgi:hypothetical protein